jgi:hypothetical protein
MGRCPYEIPSQSGYTHQFDDAAHNSCDNRRCTSQREQGKRRSDIVGHVELNLLLHGYDEEHQKDARSSSQDENDDWKLG